MIKLKIKASEELFNKYKKLQFDLDFLAGIVQNDMILDDSEYDEWYRSFDKFIDKLDELRMSTIEHIKRTNCGCCNCQISNEK